MATNLDLQEQEQLDELKAFWGRYGNLITWTLTAVLAAFAAWNGWNWWQAQQAAKAAALFDELDRAVAAADADKVSRAFEDMKSRFPGTTLTQQAGLLAARVQHEKGRADAAQASLSWVAEQAGDELAAVARLRLSGVLADKKAYDEALKQLDSIQLPEFEALVADRRGDLLLAQGKTADALQAWRTAWDKLPRDEEYRRLVEAKLTAAGAAPPVEPSATGEVR